MPIPPGFPIPSLCSTLSGAQILIVDDEPAILNLLERALVASGCKITKRASADAALAGFQPGAYHCILSDIRMPGSSGLDLLSHIREHDRNVGFVLMTGAGELDTARKAMRNGADDFLMKPLELSDLILSVKLAVEKQNLRARLLKDRHHFEQLAGERTLRLQATLESLDDALAAEKSAHRETILVLAQAAENSERDMGRHIQRVHRYTSILAMSLGDTAEAADDLGMSATLHDVGKIAVPAELLTRRGPLTPVEFRQVQQHTLAGGRILDGIASLQPAREIALSHHERWDGRGYPFGLAGKNIPRTARIAALADVWDALTSVRSYKQAWPLERALDYVSRERGGHFDPEVVDAFEASFEECEGVRLALSDQGMTSESNLGQKELLPFPRPKTSSPMPEKLPEVGRAKLN
jgi:putative two-component system response regulator